MNSNFDQVIWDQQFPIIYYIKRKDKSEKKNSIFYFRTIKFAKWKNSGDSGEAIVVSFILILINSLVIGCLLETIFSFKYKENKFHFDFKNKKYTGPKSSNE